jgi:hypothetical protein
MEIPIGHIFDSFQKVLLKHTSLDKTRSWALSMFSRGFRNEVLEYARNIADRSFDYVLLRYTSAAGLTACIKAFPGDKHLILIRDPRDVATSYIKSVNWKKGFFIKKHARRVAYSLGIYHWHIARFIRQDINSLILTLKHSYSNASLQIVRYEDLLNPTYESLSSLSKFLEIKLTEEKVELCKEIPVLGSSFYEEVKSDKKWTSKPRTSDFNPVGRWKKRLQIHQRLGLLTGLGNACKSIGYE